MAAILLRRSMSGVIEGDITIMQNILTRALEIALSTLIYHIQ